MKNYIYICGLCNDDGMDYILPVLADDGEDAKIQYIESLQNRSDLRASKWKHEETEGRFEGTTDHLFIDDDGNYHHLGFLSVTPDFLSPETKNYFNKYIEHYGKL